MDYPKISIVIPAYNEEKNIKRCLDSIFSQNYPKDKIEVIVVDNYSEDKTAEIAGSFPVTIVYNTTKHPENSKMKGFRMAAGEYFMYLDADIELIGNDWLSLMVKPLEENRELTGSFTRYKPNSRMSLINQYLSFEELQRDGLLKFFSPSIKSTIVEKKDDYSVCRYSEGKIAPQALNLYRKECLDKIFKEDDQYFWDLDVLFLLVRRGYDKFAYVEKAGLYHYHVGSLSDLIKKRIRNLTQVQKHQNRIIRYHWINFYSIKDWLKIFVWIISANIFVPSLISAMIKNIKYQRLIFFYGVIVNFLITDVIVFYYLREVLKKIFKYEGVVRVAKT